MAEDTPKLAALLLGGPKPEGEEAPEAAEKPDPNEIGREDQLQAFADFTNEALPSDERADALAFFVELVMQSGPVVKD